MAEIVADTRELEQFAKDIAGAKRELLFRLGWRGRAIVREEVPKKTTNLEKGVTQPEFDYEKGEAVITVSARSGETSGGTAEVFDKKGQLVKSVTVRGQEPYNYAEVVARGNKDARVSPKSAKAFLIPVASAPSGEGYLMINGQIFIYRTSRKGKKANPYDERAAERLGKEAPAIADAVLKEFV